MDERAFTRVAEEYAGRLYAVAYRLLRNRADAEDAVQRALMKAFAARASYSPRWAVSTWLYRVLSNVCIDELRRRRPVPEPPPGQGEHVTGGGERVDLARALGAGPREARVLLALHYVHGVSDPGLATDRGLSVHPGKNPLAPGQAVFPAAPRGWPM